MATDTFEKKLEHTKEILNQLMDPNITLETSLKLYEDGLKEIKDASKMIEEAKTKITTIENSNE